jgi:dephospho-CoA kinase
MLKVGLTGGIGSGKSTVSNVFKALGVPVYMADQKAKALIDSTKELQASIITQFGLKAFTSTGYNTSYIAEKVFNNKNLLEKLNRIIHPYVANDFLVWCKSYQNSPYIIKEAAILFESNAAKLVDYTIVVDAPESLRIKRVTRRDNISEKAVKQRISQQWPTGKITSMADWVIRNDDNELILPQLLKLHNHILTIAKANG